MRRCWSCVYTIRNPILITIIGKMPVDVLATRVRIQAPDEVFASSCAEFAGLSLDLLRPSSVCWFCVRSKKRKCRVLF